jgi:3' exoribonuclease, RNase T-like
MKIYFSVDIETDGVCAGRNNMLSLGAAAIDMDTGTIVSKFKMNLTTVPGLMPDADTMRWWKQFPEAFKQARDFAQPPKNVIKLFVEWVESIKTPDSIIFAWKPVMDLAFLRYYIHAFHPQGDLLVINGIFGRQGFGLDQKTVAALALKQPYRKTKMDSLSNSIRLDEKGEVIANHSHSSATERTVYGLGRAQLKLKSMRFLEKEI